MIGEAALARLRGWAAGLPEQARLATLMAPRAGDDPRARFRRVAQPVLDLPCWLAADLDAPDAAAIAAVGASLAGYLYVGLVDGHLDGAAVEAADAPLAERLFEYHRALLAEAGGVVPGLFDDCWRAFADGSARRLAATRADARYTAADFDASVARARPMALPGAALLDQEAVDAWVRLVGHSTRAAQLFDDLVDAERDRAAGRFTGVVRRLGGLEGPDVMRRTLHLGGGADAVLAEALEALEGARVVARERGWAAVDAGLAHHQDRVRAWRRSLANALAGALFGAPHPPEQEHV